MGGEFTYQPKWDPVGFDLLSTGSIFNPHVLPLARYFHPTWTHKHLPEIVILSQVAPVG